MLLKWHFQIDGHFSSFSVLTCLFACFRPGSRAGQEFCPGHHYDAAHPGLCPRGTRLPRGDPRDIRLPTGLWTLCGHHRAGRVCPDPSHPSSSSGSGLVSAQHCRGAALTDDHPHWALHDTHAPSEVLTRGRVWLQLRTGSTARRSTIHCSWHSSCKGKGKLLIQGSPLITLMG